MTIISIFFFNDPATTEIYTLSLHDALPICTFRFLSLEPGLYKLAASLSGFKTAQRDVIVAAGRNADAPLTLRIAAVTESVTVSAPAPILDAKATGTSTTFSRDELANVPTSRDPFALGRGVPGVLLDRV